MGEEDRERCQEALLVAEGSDWFGWYGDDFDTPLRSEFDRLYRDHLRYVYHCLRRPVPPELELPIVAARIRRWRSRRPRG